MIIRFALLLLKYGYISVYFVDLKTHEVSKKLAGKSLLRMPF